MDKSISREVNEHILEIRYKPNARVLDFRGELAASISQHMELTEWRIDNNRVDVHSKDQATRMFVAFRNAGAALRNTSLPDYFPNQATKFTRHLFTLKPLSDPVTVERLGVRSRFATPSPLPFTELLHQFETKVLNVSKEALAAFDARLIDIGAPLNFETKSGKINTNSGPMEREQLARFFEFEKKEDLPEVALYLEFDYWLRPTEPLSVKEIVALIKLYADENWQRHLRLRSLVLGS